MSEGTAILNRNLEHKVSIEIIGRELAELFWQMDASEQAEFFNKLGDLSMLSFQLQAITDSEELNAIGRYGMQLIGVYSQPSKA
jgi:hypothetical protein